MDKLIKDLVDEVVFEQEARLVQGLENIKSKFEQTIATVKQFNAALKNPGDSYGALQVIKELEQANTELDKTSQKLIETTKAHAREQKKLTDQKLQEAIIAKRAAEASLIEARARNQNAQAAKREADAIEKKNKAELKNKPVEFGQDTIKSERVTNMSGNAVNATELAQLKAEQDAIAELSARTVTNTAVKKEARQVSIEYANDLERLTGTIAQNEQHLATLKNELESVKERKRQNKGVTSELVAEETVLRQEIKRATDMLKAQHAELAAGAGSLDQAKAKLRQMDLAYQSLNKSQKDSALGQRLLNDSKNMRESIAMQEAALGKHTAVIRKNNNAMINGFNNVYNWMRKIAYIIPGLGIAGLMSLLVGGIVDVIKASKLFTKEMTEAQKAQQMLSEANVKAIDGYIEQKVKMESLIATIKKGSLTIAEQEMVVKTYNNEFGEAIGKAKTFTDAEAYIINKGPAFIEAITLRAKALANLQLAIDEAKKGIMVAEAGPDAALDWMDRFSLNVNRWMTRTGTATSRMYRDGMAGVKYYNDKAATEQHNQQMAIERRQKKFMDSYGTLMTQAQAKADAEGFNLDKKRESTKKKSLDRMIENEREAQEKILELRKNALIRMLEAEYNMIKDSSLTDFEVEQAILVARKIYDIEKEYAEKTRNKQLEEKNLTESQKVVIQLEHEEKMHDISLSFLTRVTDAKKAQVDKFKEAEEQITEQVKRENEKRQQVTAETLERQIRALEGNISNQTLSELRSLTNMYRDGEISKEQYEKRKYDIEKKWAIKAMQLQAEVFLAAAQNMNLNEDKRKEYFEKYEDMLKRIAETEIEITEHTADETIENRKKQQKAILDTANFIKDQLKEIVEWQFNNEMTTLENQKKKIDDRLEKELDALDTLTIASEEKAKLERELESQAEAERYNIQQREIALKRRKAKFDKAMAVQQTIAAGAQAVVVALTAGPILGPILAALVGALAAVQIAKILAAPLPEYKHGRKGGPAEFAWVAEDGRPERINYPGGDWKIVDKPSIEYLPAGASVISNKELMTSGLKNSILFEKSSHSNSSLGQNNGKFTELQISRLEKAFAKGQTFVSIEEDWLRTRVRMKQNLNFQEWINLNI